MFVSRLPLAVDVCFSTAPGCVCLSLDYFWLWMFVYQLLLVVDVCLSTASGCGCFSLDCFWMWMFVSRLLLTVDVCLLTGSGCGCFSLHTALFLACGALKLPVPNMFPTTTDIEL